MARTTDDLYDKLDELINVFSGGLGGSGSGTGGFSGGRKITERDFKRAEEAHNERMSKAERDNMPWELQKYKKDKENYAQRERELTQDLEDIENELNATATEKATLLQAVEDGTATEDQIKRLAELLELEKEHYSVLEQLYDLSLKQQKLSWLQSAVKDVQKVQSVAKDLYNDVTKLTEPWAKADHAASQYAKTIGLAKKGMDQLRSSSIDNVVSGKIGAKYNMSTDELLRAQTNYVKGIGRNVRMSDADQENMAAMHAVMGERSGDLAAQFENFGLNMSSTAEHAGKMFAEASEAGISFEKYTDNVAKNIKIAQNYTFKNGLKGLESMAKKATAIKLDMQQVAALADKVSTVEGAIDVSAKLQVLGGPFAQMADPLGMLNEGLNDMEGLQDRMAKMIGGMGSFDKETGEVKVSSFNKQRIKAAAEAMGTSYDALMESVNAQAKRGEITKQISASATASALPEEMQELIKNSGTFKDGKAGVSIRGQFKSLDELSGDDYEALKKETQTETQDIKDIAVDLRSIKDMREGYAKQREAVEAKLFSALGSMEKWLTGILAGWNVMHFTNALLRGILVAVSMAGKVGGLFGGGGSQMGSLGNGMGRRGRVGNLFNNGTKWLSKKGGILGKAGNFLRNTKAFTIKGARAFNRMPVVGKVKNFFGGGGGSLMGGLSNGMGSTQGLTGNINKTFSNNTFRNFSRPQLPKGVRLNSAGRLIDANTGKFINKNSLRLAQNGSIFKGGVGRTAKRASAKILGKTATKGLTTIAQNATTVASSTLGAVAGGLGIVGAVGNILTDRAVEKGKMKKGGTGHHIAKGASGAASGAALGMMIGSILPGIGTAIGGAIGGLIGGVSGLLKAGKAKQERKLEEKLEGTGIKVKGKYNRSKLKKINKGLERGEISDRMRRKLEKNGDTALLDKIDDTKIKRAEKKKKLLEAEGTLDKKKKLNIAKNRFGVANFTVGTGNFGGRGINNLFGSNGPLSNILRKSKKGFRNTQENRTAIATSFKERGLKGVWEVIKENKIAPINKGIQLTSGKKESKVKKIWDIIRGNEHISNVTNTQVNNIEGNGVKGAFNAAREKALINNNTISQENDSKGNIVSGVNNILKEKELISNNTTDTQIKVVEEKGISGAWEPVKEKKVVSTNFNSQQTSPKEFNVNLNGSLKLTGDNGQNIDIISELRKNPQLLRSLADMISKEISYLDKGTNVVQKG